MNKLYYVDVKLFDTFEEISSLIRRAVIATDEDGARDIVAKQMEEEIKEFDTDLIEMETAALYFMADLLEIPTVALLVVSDNSATGAALVGRTEEEQRKYDYGRNVVLPAMILKTADAK